tara:strand:+ start:495 stop:641 length:147 start_codon:yes stop_codon:yes gene_type:complete
MGKITSKRKYSFQEFNKYIDKELNIFASNFFAQKSKFLFIKLFLNILN